MQAILDQADPADILIVDDIPENLRLLSKFLLNHGYNVRKAISGQMALTAVKTLAPDLILLDIRMPDMNGYEVCQTLKADPITGAIPIIFISAGDEVLDKVKAFEVGGVDYITKPFHLEEVLSRVQTQIIVRSLQTKLEIQNLQLNQTIAELKRTQAELIQKEKMAGLGKVAAGIAHEINNPLSFILCNLNPAHEYINQLIEIFHFCQQTFPDLTPRVNENFEQVDLEFLIPDLKRVINSMRNGAERIRSVVLALQIFTRLNQSGIKAVNIHESIDSVLTLLHHQLNDPNLPTLIKIEKQYHNLPPIDCFPDQINQAIFNLILNAIEAVKRKAEQPKSDNSAPTPYRPTITIRTQCTHADTLTINIQDNGVGIPPEQQSQLFEPFFTTKLPGQGVGLGLLTSRRIIEEIHNGKLSYCSEPDIGSEFTIEIPLYLDRRTGIT